MNESLAAACNEFEQIVLAGMLRSAGIGRSNGADPASGNADDDTASSPSESNAYSELFVQALSGALERAGGLGISRTLRAALGKRLR
jgi:hypothetical protein